MKKSNAERVLALLQKRNARYKFKELMRLTRLSLKDMRAAIAELRKTQKNLVFAKFDKTYYLSDTPTWYSLQTDLSQEMPDEGSFGMISDSHLGSVAERLDVLNDAYDEFARRGITKVFHCGDLTDGFDEYRGHINFVKVHGDQPQALYAIQKYPRRKGITTYVIGGNHDDAYSRRQIDRVSLVSKGFHHQGKEVAGREDIVYLGQYSHYIILPQEVTMHMLHPRGGAVYALSYKIQKRSENMDKNVRPDIQLSGHFHTFTHVCLNGTHFVALPGMQDETEFFKRLGLARSIGFAIGHYRIKDGKLRSFSPELFMFA